MYIHVYIDVDIDIDISIYKDPHLDFGPQMSELLNA